MQIGLRQFCAETLSWFECAVLEGGASRSALASELCARANWRNARGEPCVSSARKILPRLASQLGLKLPAAAAPPPAGDALPSHPDLHVETTLAALGTVSLEPAEGREGSRRFRSMMASHHPEGVPRHPGKTLNYLVISSRFGCLGGIGFCAASWHQKARDRYIGWSARARCAGLGRMVNNHRFLLLPSVRVPDLASHVLAQATARVADDWEARHGDRPVLAYSYVGPEHAGTSYRAAGWEDAGATSGCPPGRRGAGPVRRVWMKSLQAGWREALCEEPERVAGRMGSLHLGADADWAEREFGRGTHPDGRVRRRIEEMGRCWEKRPGTPLPEIFPDRASQEAAYRLLSNERVAVDDILEGHRETTVERCRHAGVVLMVQDTTMLNYDNLRDATNGLAALGGGGKGTVGVPVHATLAVAQGGRPLGVCALEGDFRESVEAKAAREPGVAQEPESARWLRSLEQAAAVGHACSNTRVISVADREGDIWGLYARQAEDPAAAGLLVRACRSKQRKVLVDGKKLDLGKHMDTLPPCASRSIEIPARGGRAARKKRKAVLALRIARVELVAPEGKSPRTLPMTAVLVAERNPPSGARQPLRWLLLCSEGEATPEWADRIRQWYETRWSIEEFFRVLKTGTRIEDRRLDDAEDLRKCLAFDAVTAWRVFDLDRAARETPDSPADEIMSRDEIFMLYLGLYDYRVIRCRAPPDYIPDLRTFAIDLARYVGFIPSKRQPMPGTAKLWTGMTYLMQATAALQQMRSAGMLRETGQ